MNINDFDKHEEAILRLTVEEKVHNLIFECLRRQMCLRLSSRIYFKDIDKSKVDKLIDDVFNLLK